MNKLTKILTIVGVAGFFISSLMGANVGQALLIPVICVAIYLIRKVMGDGPRLT